MIFRLAVISSALAFVAGQDETANEDLEMPASADLMRASGVTVTDSTASGVFTVRQRDIATFDFRWVLEDVSGESLTGGFLHCPITAGSTTETGPIAATVFDIDLLQEGGESIVGSGLELINQMNNNQCYLNFTTEANPGGELRGNIQSDLIVSDVDQADVSTSAASTVMTSIALIASMVATVASLL